MDITAIVTTYNRQDMALKAIESVVRQTRPPNRVLVVDDGSTDSTALAIERHFPQVTILTQDNSGISSARNTGIGKTPAGADSWVAFLDDDDYWRPEKLELQERFIAQNPGYQICYTDEIWYRNGVRVNPGLQHSKTGGRIFDRALESCIISASSALIRRDLFSTVGRFDESLPVCEDYDMWLRISAHNEIGFIPQPLIVKCNGHGLPQLSTARGQDRFRLRAIENILQNGKLNDADRRSAVRVLIEKCNILAEGNEKRGKTAIASIYRTLIKEYRD